MCNSYQYSETTRIERVGFTFTQMGSNKLYDHKGPPVIKVFDIWRVHYCIMHATIPFGKDISKYMHEIFVGDKDDLKMRVEHFSINTTSIYLL